MAVKLRLRRMGRKKRPFYRLIAADARSPRDGRFIEELGYYNPLENPVTIEVNEDRVLYWLTQGAIPTETVKSLLRKKGITLRFDLLKRGVSEEKIDEELKKWEVLQIEKRKRQMAASTESAKVKPAKEAGETETEAAKIKETKTEEVKAEETNAPEETAATVEEEGQTAETSETPEAVETAGKEDEVQAPEASEDEKNSESEQTETDKKE